MRTLFKENRVKAKSVKDFINKYYKRSRSIARGQDVFERLIERVEDDIKTEGYSIISRHDNNTGEVVAWSPDWSKATR